MSSWSVDAYRADVARVFSGQGEEPVLNGSTAHAKIVVEEAFKAARSRVRILSNHLESECYDADQVCSAMRSFLAKEGATLDILVEDVGSSDDRMARRTFVSEARAKGGEAVSLMKVPEELVSKYSFNFLLVDDCAYRYESDRSNPMAVVVGGALARGGVERLSDIFDQIKVKCTPISIGEFQS